MHVSGESVNVASQGAWSSGHEICESAAPWMPFRAIRRMSLALPAEVLSTVQRVCDRALNLPVASARSNKHGPKAGMEMLFGRTVQHLPEGDGVVKDRPLVFVVKKKRRSGKSGRSNWPKNKAERLARERSKAERALLAAQRAAAAALREASRNMDDGFGAYAVRCPAEWMAIAEVRQALAANMGVPACELSPSAAVAATMLPGRIDAYTDGFAVILSGSGGTDSSAELQMGQAVRLHRGGAMCDFITPGMLRGLVFHAS